MSSLSWFRILGEFVDGDFVDGDFIDSYVTSSSIYQSFYATPAPK